MGRRGGKERTKRSEYKSFFDDKVYWQSEQLNRDLFLYYKNVISQLAMSRFRWLNLPKTCNARYLEWVLLHEGVASIAYPPSLKGTFYSLKAAQVGRPNKYGEPVGWKCIGDDGSQFYANWNSGAYIYDNETRFPLIMGINLYANELTHIRITKRVNRLHQQIPFVFKAPQEYKQVVTDMFAKISGGEPAFIGTKALDTIDVEAIQTGVTYIGKELAQDEQNVWDRIYTMLGIQNSPFKTERQTEDEIRASQEPTDIITLNSLNCRRRAAAHLNEMFGGYLEAPIEVVWARDNISANINFINNIETQLREIN